MTEDEQFEANDKYSIADLHKTAPENIWLQIDQEANPIDGWEFKTWCEYEVNDNDLEYVRADLVESLRQQLAAALAAVKVKDEFVRLLRDYIPNSAVGNVTVQEALDIQPDDAALKTWLGEPVAWADAYGNVIRKSTKEFSRNSMTAAYSIALYSPNLPLGETK